MAAVIVGEERYVFDCEWYDQQAELIRYYRILTKKRAYTYIKFPQTICLLTTVIIVR